MFALLWYIDWSSIRRKLMIVHKAESTASGFSTAFPSCKSGDQLVWVLLVGIRSTPGSELRYLESRNVMQYQLPFKWEKNYFLSSLQILSFTERSKLSQWRGGFQFSVFIQGFSISWPCVMRGVCPTPPLPLQQHQPPSHYWRLPFLRTRAV